MTERNPGDKDRVSRPHDFARPIFPRGLLTITLDGLSERGTTRSLGSLYILNSLFSRALETSLTPSYLLPVCLNAMLARFSGQDSLVTSLVVAKMVSLVF